MAGMVDTGRQFDDQALALLRSCIGRTLIAYEAYCPFGEDNIYAHARLSFDEFDIDLLNRHEAIVIGPDYEEQQVAVLSARESNGEALWHPKGRALTRVELDVPVDDVLVVVDTILLTRGSRRLNKLVLVQAVVFETHDENGEVQLLAFDRDIWTDEYLNVVRGPKISAVTRDHRPDYIVEPPHSYKFGRNIVRLSQPH